MSTSQNSRKDHHFQNFFKNLFSKWSDISEFLLSLGWNNAVGFVVFGSMFLGYPVSFLSLTVGSAMMFFGLVGGFILFLFQGLNGWRKP